MTIELKPEAAAVAELLIPHIAKKFDEAGNLTIDKAVAEEVLKAAGTSVEEYERVSGAITHLVAGTASALSSGVVDEFKSKPTVNELNFKFPIAGKDAVEGKVARSKTYQDGKGGTTTKYGVMIVGLEMYANNKGAGTLKKVREDLNQRAAAALAD